LLVGASAAAAGAAVGAAAPAAVGAVLAGGAAALPQAANSALTPAVALSAKNFRRLIGVPAMGKPPFPDRAFVYPKSIDLPMGSIICDQYANQFRSYRSPGHKALECRYYAWMRFFDIGCGGAASRPLTGLWARSNRGATSCAKDRLFID
jgi:hypothetical protein